MKIKQHLPLFQLESAKLRGLRGNVGYVGPWVAWVTWVKIFFTWVIIFTWVAWVKYIFAWVNFYLLDAIILLYYN